MPPSTTEFGVDVDAVLDVPLRWALCTGRKNLGNALARRLAFLRSMLNAGLTSAQVSELRSDVVRAVMEDPRVQEIADLGFAFDPQTSSLRISIVVETAEGPFSFVLVANSLTVDVLNAGVQQAATTVAPDTLAIPVPGPAGAPGGPGQAGATGEKGDPGSGGGAGLFRFRPDLDSSTGTEEVVDQVTVDFSKFPGGTLTLELACRVLSAAGTATFKVYVGGTYDTANGTLVITGTIASGTLTVSGFSGTLTNPTGLRAVKLTITSSGAAVAAEIRDATLSITD